jgi:alpha-L-fucosidase
MINNTGLSALGEVSHPEIDSVTFERGNPAFVDRSKRPIAGEMCQVLNDHWGYAINDCNYKSVKELLENLVDCRRYDCNFLLNTGLRGDGTVNPMDACILGEIGKWVYKNSEVVYNAKSCDIKAENAIILQGDDCYYVVIKNVPMSADPNVQRQERIGQVCVKGEVLSAEWLDNGEGIEVVDGMFYMSPFAYGESRSIRVAKLKMDM